MNYLIIDIATNKILKTGNMQDSVFRSYQAPFGQRIIENTWGAQAGTDSWDTSSAAPKRMSSLEETITQSAKVLPINTLLTFSGIPVGTKVHSYGKRGLRQIDQVDDGTYEYDTDAVGEHLFGFKHPLYKDWLDVHVEVTE